MAIVQSRRWFVTINNPGEKNLSHSAIKDIVARGTAPVYWCMCDEEGDECETLHTHLYFVWKSPVRFDTIRKMFACSHCDKPDGTSPECRAYVLKDGEKFNKEDSGHYHYVDKTGKEHSGINYSATFEEFGTLPHEHQGSRGDLSGLYNMIKQGADTYEILETCPEFVRDIDNIERTRQIILEKKFRNIFRKLEVTYIYGTTGVGKTRMVMEQYGYDKCYRVTDYAHPFDGYKGQDVIIFEEFRNSLKIADMLVYLDGYPVELPCRYANKQACFTKVYIISNWALELQYPLIQAETPLTYQAWLRRIHTVRIFSADGKYTDQNIQDYFKFKSVDVQWPT